MKKAVWIKVVSIVVFVGSVLGILMGVTKMPNEENNGFERKLISNEPIVPSRDWHYTEDLAKIIGYSNSSIYIGGEMPTSFLILQRDFSGKDTLMINYDIPPKKMVPFQSFVDSPFLYIHVNNMRTILYGKFPNENLSISELKGLSFTKSIQISNNSIIVRSFTDDMLNQVFKKIDLQNGKILIDTNIAELSDNSAGMMTDGMLLYAKPVNKLLYVEFFRNKFYCLDTNLNLLYKASTIDTSSVNNIGLGHENESDSVKKLVPNTSRVKVNYAVFYDSNFLYIVSGKRGDNQSVASYNSNVNIDKYDIITGKYTNSFLIKKANNKSFKSAMIVEDSLYALFDNQLRVYPLDN